MAYALLTVKIYYCWSLFQLEVPFVCSK